MEYKNNKTGVVIATPCIVSGGDWIKIDKEIENQTVIPEIIPDNSKPMNSEDEKIGNEDFDGITKSQIMQELDAFGIAYDKKANKQVLYDLMMSQGK